METVPTPEGHVDPQVLLTHLNEAAKSPSTFKPNDELRKSLLAASRMLAASLETPVESIFRFGWQPHQNAAIRIAIELDLFSLISKSQNHGMSAAELATATKADKELIIRIMRVLTAIGVFTEVGVQQYAGTPLSEAWISPPLRDCSRHLYDVASYSVYHLPEFLKRTDYQNPEDVSHGPFQFAHKTDDGIFQWLHDRPERLKIFNSWMEGHGQARKPWFSSLPVEQLNTPRLSENEEAVFMVDIGGGKGHDLEAFRIAFPEAKGRLILEDLPKTIDALPDHRKPLMEAIKYNFFATPQPVIGARAYYFRSVFHDFPDAKCLEILRNTVSAMEPGYSKLLINDWILLDKGSSFPAAMMDLHMMANLAAKERTESQWKQLLESAGLTIVKMWRSGGEEGVIEAVLKEAL